MNEADALDLLKAAMWTTILAAGPAVVAAMIVGILIAFIQALTQIQEMTLTFVPKIVAAMAMIAFSASFVGAQVFAFSQRVYQWIGDGFSR